MSTVKGFKIRDDGSLLTPEFRVSFPKVFTPDEENKKYGLRAIFDGDVNFSVLEAALNTAAKELFPAGRPKGFMWPIHGEEDSDREEHKGKFYINLSAGKYRPGLVDANKADILDEAEFYPGCWARAVITVYAWNNKKVGKAGVSVGLRNVQKLRDDEPLVSRTSAADEFDAVCDPATDDL